MKTRCRDCHLLIEWDEEVSDWVTDNFESACLEGENDNWHKDHNPIAFNDYLTIIEETHDTKKSRRY